MDKIKLIKILSQRFGVSELEVSSLVDIIFLAMRKAFKDNKNVNIPDFGKFIVHQKKIDGVFTKTVSFSSSKKFSDEVNKNYDNLKPFIISAYNLKESSNYYLTEISEGYKIDNDVFFEFEEDIPEVIEAINEDKVETPEVIGTVNIDNSNTPENIETSVEDTKESGAKEKSNVKSSKLQTVFESTVFLDESEDFKINKSEKVIPVIHHLNEVPAEKKIELEVIIEQKSEIPNVPVIPDVIEKNGEPVEEKIKYNFQNELKDSEYGKNIEDEILDLLKKRRLLLEQITEKEGYFKTVSKKNDVNIIESIEKAEPVIPEIIAPIIPEAPIKNEVTQENIIEKIPSDITEESKPDSEDTILFDELEKRLKELSELSQHLEVVKEKTEHIKPNSELRIFEKLLSEKPVETSKPFVEITPTFPEIIIRDPEQEISKVKIEIPNPEPEIPQGPIAIIEEIEPEKVEPIEPKSLTEAFTESNLKSIIEHHNLEDDNNTNDAKSFNDIFKNVNKPTAELIPQTVHKTSKIGTGIRLIVTLFFVLLAASIFFLLYKNLLKTDSSSNLSDTVGGKVIDSIAKVIKNDTIKNQASFPLEILTEDNIIEKEGNVFYRESSEGYKIQIANFDKLTNAEKFINSLKEKNFDAKIERVDLPMSKVDYRIILGPFKTLQEAKNYYSKSVMILNFIKILTPAKSNFLVL